MYPTGDSPVDPATLAARLSIEPGRLRRSMRLGLVTSRVETGTGADEGTLRLTVRCGNSVWRAVVGSEHELLREETFGLDAGPPGSASHP
ncbi:MAG: DUF6522 family protein [Mesorhizobium sp.]|nr:DUF6522 family protein [Mesorhizobium sp.]